MNDASRANEFNLSLAPPSHSRAGAILLVIATALWGTTFALVKLAQRDLPPSALACARFAVAAVAMSPFLFAGKKRPSAPALWRDAGELSLWLMMGYATQAVGLLHTTVNRSAFITAMSVIFVPVLSALAGRGSRPIVWASAIAAFIGCGLLSYDGSRPNIGDLWTLMCAISWGFYIFRLEGISQRHSAMQLAAAQLALVAVLMGGWVAVNPPHGVHIPWLTIIYLGVFTTAATTLLQTIGQRTVSAPRAAIIFTMEPVFASLFGFLWMGEMMGARGYCGAMLIILAAVACQIAPPSRLIPQRIIPQPGSSPRACDTPSSPESIPPAAPESRRR